MGDLITEPGVYPDIPEDFYHSDPVEGRSLSQSGAKLLLDCPARFKWERDHPTESTADMDTGSAAHTMILGAGPEVVEVEFDTYHTKAAKEAKAEAKAAGKIPLLRPRYQAVVEMADTLKAHPLASRLFDPETGRAEVTLVWECPDTGVTRRARLDWLPDPSPLRRLLVPDLKSTVSVAPRAFAKSIAKFGYHQQAATYLQGIRELGLTDDPDAGFVFVVQEKAPPYLVQVYEPDADALAEGARLNRSACATYRECMAGGEWPSYSDGIELLSLPNWAYAN